MGNVRVKSGFGEPSQELPVLCEVVPFLLPGERKYLEAIAKYPVRKLTRISAPLNCSTRAVYHLVDDFSQLMHASISTPNLKRTKKDK